MSYSKDLIAASATPAILSILARGDSYGYAILSRVREASDGRLEWSEGMLYPILHRLEKKGLVSSYWGQSEAGRRRKYYRLKRSGQRALTQERQAWADLTALLQRLDADPACST